MKQKLLTLFTLLLFVCSGAWAQDVFTELRTVDFTSLGQYTSFSTTAKENHVTETGYTDIVFYTTSATKTMKINPTAGVGVDFAGQNYGGSQFIAIPLTGVNGKIKVTFHHQYNSGKAKFKVAYSDNAASYVTDPPSGAEAADGNKADTQCSWTSETLEHTNGYLYIGEAGTSYPYLKKVVVETLATTGVTNPSFDVAAGSSIVKNTANAVTLTSAGNTIYYKWNTTPDAYATGAALVAAADGNGPSPVAVTTPLTTGTWYLYAVAKNGDDYSDVVKRSYTITNPTYSISYANGGGSGEMSNTIVEEGNDQVLPANTFTRDCYSFAGWVANVNVKISGATVSAGEIIDDGATIEDVTENITLTAQWTASYASGKYDFQTGATIGTSPSKTVDTEDKDYAAFQIDNLYFSAMKIGYDDGHTSATGDGDNFNGWKLKTKDATIKFVVESDKLVTIGIGSIGSGGAAKIDYTNLDGESKTASFSAGTNHNYLVKGGTLVTITHNGTNGKTVTLKKIFIQDYVPVTVSAYGLATYASDNALNFGGVEGIKAYRATISANTITFTQVTEVPAGEGVLLKATTGEGVRNFDIPVTTTAAWAADDNDFVRGTDAEVVTSDGTNYNYILSTKDGVLGFYNANGTFVARNRAYLTTTEAPSAKGLTMIFADEEETTGIRSIENRELRSENYDYYNLSGQRVGKDYKGIVIVNGKKMLNK